MGGEYPLASSHSAESSENSSDGARNVALLYLFGSGGGQALCPLVTYLMDVGGVPHHILWRWIFGVGSILLLGFVWVGCFCLHSEVKFPLVVGWLLVGLRYFLDISIGSFGFKQPAPDSGQLLVSCFVSWPPKIARNLPKAKRQKKLTRTISIGYRWWFQRLFNFHPHFGEDPHFDSFVSKGLKPLTV